MGVHIGDVGTIFRVNLTDQDGVALDLRTATVLEIVFVKPDCTLDTQTAVATGEPGQISYTTVLDDIDAVGSWAFYAHIESPTRICTTGQMYFQVFPIPGG